MPPTTEKIETQAVANEGPGAQTAESQSTQQQQPSARATVYDEDYVRTLRSENAQWRSKLRDLEAQIEERKRRDDEESGKYQELYQKEHVALESLKAMARKRVQEIGSRYRAIVLGLPADLESIVALPFDSLEVDDNLVPNFGSIDEKLKPTLERLKSLQAPAPVVQPTAEPAQKGKPTVIAEHPTRPQATQSKITMEGFGQRLASRLSTTSSGQNQGK